MIGERYRIDICDDCLMFLANGDVPDNRPNLPDEIDGLWTGFDVVLSGSEESEPFFSWRPCGCCGSRLGGNRVEATAVTFAKESSHD
jgi:hypothetical protein